LAIAAGVGVGFIFKTVELWAWGSAGENIITVTLVAAWWLFVAFWVFLGVGLITGYVTIS
jgi:hypothetical protein